MSRKVFISFLGTNSYIACNYYEEGDKSKKVSNVQYIQEAIVQLYCKEFIEDDKFYFFLTEDAKKMNWESNGQYNKDTEKYDKQNEGLKDKLKKLQLSSKPNVIDIKEGFTEKEIWNIFDIITNIVQQDDELFLDITHGFRSLPMLAMVLTNYLKTVKDIKVKAIFYGAFEVLGPAPKVKQMPLENRNAPITNLISFSKLQDWSSAAQMFTKSGRASSLKELSIEEIKPLLKETKGKDKFASKIRDIGNNLENFTRAITTNRGNSIFEGEEIVKLRKGLDEIKKSESPNEYKPFLFLVEKAIDEFKDIKEKDSNNWFFVSRWCLKNLLIQQGITIFREGIVTHILTYINNKYDKNLNYDNIDDRSLCEALMYSTQPTVKNEDYKKSVIENMEVFNKLKLDDNFIEVARLYNSSLDLRNDINHSGYGKNNSRKPSVFHDKLKSLISDFESTIILPSLEI